MKAFWQNLGSRQKRTVLAGGALILVILFVQLALLPFLESKGKIRRSIKANEAALKEMYLLENEYRSIKDNFDAIQSALAQRPPDFSFFSFIEKKAGEAGVRGNMKSLQPSKPSQAGSFEEIAADIKFEKVTLKQIVDFLAAAEAPGSAIVLSRISIGRSPESAEYLSAQLRLVTFQRAGAIAAPSGAR